MFYCSENEIAFTDIEDAATQTTSITQPGKLKVIFDTDIAEDVDDVGAIAVLHALAAKGEIDILGMMVSMPVEYGAPALDALNTYFTPPGIPIGTLRNSQDAAGSGNLLVYNKALATSFPNDLQHAVLPLAFKILILKCFGM